MSESGRDRGPGGDEDLAFASLAQVAALIASQCVSPLEVVAATLQRIDRLNPRYNAYLSIAERAMHDARAAERAVAKGRAGPLLGVPIAIKDLILTKDGVTTAGSKIFGEGLPSAEDAPVVRRLRRAGAVIIGRANLHEVALGVTNDNEHFGPARNPWDPTRISGGSSGGSAVAVAAGLCYGAVGTDTRGSIRIPAACCGVTGLKPTRGLIATAGVIPLSASLDHVGPLTRSVEDAALLLAAMQGGAKSLHQYRTALDRPTRGLRVGVSEFHLRDLDPEVASAVEQAVQTFRARKQAIEVVSIPELDEAQEASRVLTAAEAVAYHDVHLRQQPQAYGPLLRGRLESGYRLSALEYLDAHRIRRRIVAAFARVFADYDCLLGATVCGFPPRIGETTVRCGSHEEPIVPSFTRLTAPQNMGGVPALSIPCGFGREKLPVGLQLIAASGRDDVLFTLAHWYQRETDWHRRFADNFPAAG